MIGYVISKKKKLKKLEDLVFKLFWNISVLRNFRKAAQNITTQILTVKRVEVRLFYFSEKIRINFKRLARIPFGKSTKVMVTKLFFEKRRPY